MKGDQIQQIFDTIMLGEEGKTYTLSFSDEKSAESARVALYRERCSFTAKSKEKVSVSVERKYNKQKGIFLLELTKISTAFQLFEGTLETGLKPIKLVEREEEEDFCLPSDLDIKVVQTPEEELPNILAAMRADNYSDDEIEAYFTAAEDEYNQFKNNKWKEYELGKAD